MGDNPALVPLKTLYKWLLLMMPEQKYCYSKDLHAIYD